MELAENVGLILVYIFYGAAFIFLSLIIFLHSAGPVELISQRALKFLGFFGLIHGTNEWLEITKFADPVLWSSGVHLVSAMLIAASYFSLPFFGVETLVQLKRWPDRARWIPFGLLSVWLVAVIVYGFSSPRFPAVVQGADILSRYFLCLPGAWLAGYALWMTQRTKARSLHENIPLFLKITAVFWVLYGFLGGVIVPVGAFFPATVWNAEIFQATFGFPVVLLRGLCALVIGGILGHIFTVKEARMRSEWQRLRNEFISIIAHDLKSSVSGIMAATELIERTPGEKRDTETFSNLIRHVRSGAGNLNRMVSDLMDASLIDAERMKLTVREIDLGQVVQEIVARTMAISKDHQIRLDTLGNQKLIIQGDAGRLDQVLGNLLDNAIKYSPPQTEIKVTIESRIDEVVISVANVGMIPPENQVRIFDRFRRADGAHRDVKGLGLGLYIVKGLIEAHGGKAWVTCRDNQTTFSFSLPGAQVRVS